jgi:Domain of unknown function (DUF1707)/Cell wall-active antibiotics response 4TMS YvqF
VRASDAEREAVTERLRDAAAEGRVTLEELADRTEAAFGASTRAELDQLVSDLPAARPAREPERAPRRWFFGIMGGDTLRGPMRLAGTCTIVNLMGGTDLDLSQARIEDGELTLRIVSIMGGSTIHVPHGVNVERTGFSLMGGDDVATGEEPFPPPDAPVVRVRAFNLMGGNDIKRGAPRPRRWPWLERPPEPD